MTSTTVLTSAAQSVLTIPEILWEASLGVYLILKGFRKEGLDRLGVAGGDMLERPAPAPAMAPAVWLAD